MKRLLPDLLFPNLRRQSTRLTMNARARRLNLLMVMVLSSVPGTAWGIQDPPVVPPDQAAPTVPAPVASPPASPVVQEKQQLARFRQLQKEIRDTKSQITKRLLDAPAGNLGGTQQVLQDVEALKKRVQELEAEATETAFEAYCEAPQEAATLAPIAIRKIRGWLGDGQAEGGYRPELALAACQKVTGNGSTNPYIYLLGAQAAYALQAYDESLAFLNRARELGGQINEAFIERTQAAKANWLQEQELRAQEAQQLLPQIKLNTRLGPIVIELFEDQAPQAVNNMVRLVEDGFYRDSKFFFNRSGMIAVAGCPNGDGTGHAGYYLPDESKREDARHHVLGSVSLFHQAPGTDCSQFSICSQAAPERDGEFTVIGRVVEGLEVVYQIPNTGISNDRTQAEPVLIESAEVIRKRDHIYEASEKIAIAADGSPAPGVAFEPGSTSEGSSSDGSSSEGSSSEGSSSGGSDSGTAGEADGGGTWPTVANGGP